VAPVVGWVVDDVEEEVPEVTGAFGCAGITILLSAGDVDANYW
jgi:hypothetical protein